MPLASCGDDSEDEGDGGGDFVTQADALCTDAARDRIATQQEVPESEQEALAQLAEQQQIRERYLRELEALEPTEDAADAYREFLDHRREVLETAAREPALIRQGVAPDEPRYQELIASLDESGEAAESAAADAGLEACGGVLPESEKEKVVDIVTEFETKPLDDCREFATAAAIEELFGGLKACQRTQKNPPPEGFTKRVQIQEVRGIEGVSAGVKAALSGGVADGQEVEYVLHYEDGTYKVAAVFLQAKS
jgi:hypothetical protein